MRKALLFKSLLLFFILLAVSITAQDDPPPNDTIFLELSLTENGVIAIDSLGNEWVYNFDDDIFVLGELPLDLERRNIEDLLSDEDISVDIRCTEEITVKRFARSVIVGLDEYVDGDILAMGRVSVKGWVKGDIVSVNGRVMVSRNARVDGNIEAPQIIVKDGGEVLGREIIRDTPLDLDDLATTFSMDGVIVIIILLAFILLVTFLLHTLMPRQLANVNQCITNHKVKTTFLGFVLLFAMPVIIVLVAITIIGIILIPLIPILYIIAMIMGLAVIGEKTGKAVLRKYLSGERQPVFESIVGIFILVLPWIISMTFWGMGTTIGYTFGGIFLGVASIANFYPIFSGLGAVLLTRFGFRIHTSWKERQRHAEPTKAPVPPPIPTAPNGFHPHNNSTTFTPPPKPDLPNPPGPTPPDNL